MNRSLICFLAVLIFSFSQVMGQAPDLLSKGNEETVGPNGRLSTIAMDALGQPHIVSDGSTYAYIYDRMGGVWQATSLNVGNSGYKQYYNPYMEIDSQDRAWVSGILVSGLGLIVREGMSTNPTAPVFSDQRVRGANTWDSGNLSIDPAFPTDCVLMSAYGQWKKVRYSATSATKVVDAGSGTLYAGQDGEKKGFWISKAGSVAHADGTTHGVWHLAINGYSDPYPSQYQNSYRLAQGLARVTWASYNPYSSMGDDGAYVSCVSDSLNPQIAYMAADFSVNGRYSGTAGVALNIWNGSAMVFNPTSILSVDAAGSSGLRRFAPQLAPAKYGGAFITWTRASRVKLRYVSSTGTLGPEWDISAGIWSSLCTDAQGNVHIVYNNNNAIRYRKLIMSNTAQYLTQAGDFNGDGKDDMGVFDPTAADWYVKTIGGTTLIWDKNWGWNGALPVPGDYDGDGYDDLGAYDPKSGDWYIWSVNQNKSLAMPVNWGGTGMFPVYGDYDHDGADDLAVFSDVDGKWYVWSFKKNDLLGIDSWGGSGNRPVPGDYNGDGNFDLCVFSPLDAKWYIKEMNLILVDNVNWGFSTATTPVGDYNGDGKADLVAYDPATSDWYIKTLSGQVLAWDVNWGYSGCAAVPGDYNGDGTNDLAAYDPASGNWYVRTMNNVVLAWATNWGYPGTVAVPGDYNNDHKADLAVYDAAQGKWYVRKLDGSIIGWDLSWGFPSGMAVPGDYNGDGRADLAVYDKNTYKWYIRDVAGNVLLWDVAWGYAGGTPVPGDFDGDGASDLAIFDKARGKWSVWSLKKYQIIFQDVVAWGNTGASPVSGDFDGDGRTDLAAFNAPSGTWSAMRYGRVLRWATSWGTSTMIPVPGDFDGDGLWDLTLFDQKGGGYWYSWSSTNAAIKWNYQYGSSSMIPAAGDYDGDGRQDIAVFDTTESKWYSVTTSGTTITWGNQWGFTGVVPLGYMAR